MTDTINHNGAHDTHDVNTSTVDAGDTSDELEEVAQMWEQRRTKYEARKRDLNRRIDALLDERAVATAELTRCNREITAARTAVKVRGRKKNTATAKGKGR